MTKNFLTIVLGAVLNGIVLTSLAQEHCATEEYNKNFYIEGRKLTPAKFSKWLSTLRQTSTLRPMRTSAEPALIPVVVHVIHKGEPLGSGTNISEAQILTQIEVLNEDYQRLNADTTATPDEFKSLASFLEIKFVMAKRDPNGLPTNGIIRKVGSRETWDPFTHDDLLKAESYWPAEDYFNIWVCDLSGENLGYAQYPDANLPGLEGVDKENRLTDGVAIDYRVCGSSDKGNFPDLRVPYDKGRTVSHEVGHWLGLLHIFATPGNCTSDDYIDDTPRQNQSYNGNCPTHPVSSCGTVDMFQNYMDYTADDCMNLFTQGQANRMQLVLDNALRRFSLLNSIGAFPPDIEYDDIALTMINSPSFISCNTEVNPLITIQNMGSNAITNVDVIYGTIGSPLFAFTIGIDSLKSGQQQLLSLPGFTVDPGEYDFYCEINISESTDINPENNSLSTFIIIDNKKAEVPFIEKFELQSLDESLWTVFNRDQASTWEVYNFNNLSAGLIKLFNYNSIGEEDWLISPAFDYTFAAAAALRFKVSYALNQGFNDNLTILISRDCGNSFQEIYNAEGSAFKVENSAEYWQPVTEDDWKTITLDISDFAGEPEVRIAFKTTNGFGNNLYLDDIELFIQSIHDIVDIPEGNITLFPNPTNGPQFSVGVKTSEKEDVLIQVFSSNGQLVINQLQVGALNQVYTFDLTGNREGVYLVKVTGNTINAVNKLVYRP